jgi:diguanylate cyclase (GGDEF)-like protein
MSNNVLKKIRFVISISLSALVALIFLFIIFEVKSKISGRTYLDDRWNIVYNDTVSNATKLSEFRFPIAQTNDKFILTTTLPELSGDITLSVPVDHSTITVKIDGQEIYEYGKDLFAKCILVGSGYHWVKIPQEASKHQLSIELMATENNSFSKISPFYYESSDISYRNFYLDQFPTLFVCIFLVGFGILLLLITTFMLHFNHDALQVAYIALFSILIALWFGSNYRIFQLVSLNYSQNTLIEYLALYMAPVPITLFFRTIYKEQKTEHRILNGYVVVSSLFAASSLVLHILDINHLTQSLYFFQAYIVTEIVFILFSAIRAFKRKTCENRLILIGLVLLAFFVSLDLIRFWSEKFSFHFFTTQVRSFMPIGIISFVICLLFSYFHLIFRTIATNTEHELLKKLAFTDMLTGLSNRTQMDKYMEELGANNENTPLPSYAIINMDLNRLKAINDSFGHEAGDKYLKRFAQHLQRHFSGIGEVGRVGGDEFLVILPNVTKEECERLVASLEKAIAEENAKLTTIPLSFSYGICNSNEFVHATAKKLYRLADYRMYEMKRKYRNIIKEQTREESKQDEYIN